MQLNIIQSVNFLELSPFHWNLKNFQRERIVMTEIHSTKISSTLFFVFIPNHWNDQRKVLFEIVQVCKNISKRSHIHLESDLRATIQNHFGYAYPCGSRNESSQHKEIWPMILGISWRSHWTWTKTGMVLCFSFTESPSNVEQKSSILDQR